MGYTNIRLADGTVIKTFIIYTEKGAFIALEGKQVKVTYSKKHDMFVVLDGEAEPFLDTEKMKCFLECAVQHYQQAPGWFVDGWLDGLSIRLQEDWQGITLDELCTLAKLHDEDGWMPEALAVNTAYKLYERLGHTTTGIAGF